MNSRSRSTGFRLRAAAAALLSEFPEITALYLFGSRRHRTRSTRSDIDILVETTGHLKASELRDYCLNHYPALDPFIIEGAKATSCANDSYIEAASKPELIRLLDAVRFWDRAMGQCQVDIDWEPKIAHGVTFSFTTLPNLYVAQTALCTLQELAAQNGVPSEPFLGATVDEVTDTLIEILRRILQSASPKSGRAAAPTPLENEYVFQSLFWTVFKPWFPELAREEVTIRYDSQVKRADFNMARNRIVFELKHIRDANTKAAVQKTLYGLGDLYRRNANVGAIVFAVLVDADVQLDDRRWERDYSHTSASPRVHTVVIRNIPKARQ
jgi:REase_DpnII-MboI/Polymerase beta, Nucleotidyltransferase